MTLEELAYESRMDEKHLGKCNAYWIDHRKFPLPAAIAIIDFTYFFMGNLLVVVFFRFLAEHVDEAVSNGVVEVGSKRSFIWNVFHICHPHSI